MNTPTYLEPKLQEILAMEGDGADKRRLWVVILGLKVFMDGDLYCLLWGDNMQSGVVGFGKTPVAAIYDFEKAMYEQYGWRVNP